MLLKLDYEILNLSFYVLLFYYELIPILQVVRVSVLDVIMQLSPGSLRSLLVRARESLGSDWFSVIT